MESEPSQEVLNLAPLDICTSTNPEVIESSEEYDDIPDPKQLTISFSPAKQNSGERPFHCDICGLGFTQKGNLSRHKQIHTPHKPFKCDICPYASRRKDALINHRSTHCIEKPFKCVKCVQAYKQKSSLRDHLKSMHRLSAEEVKLILPDGMLFRPSLDILSNNIDDLSASLSNKGKSDEYIRRKLSEVDDMYDGISQVLKQSYGYGLCDSSSPDSPTVSQEDEEAPQDLSTTSHDSKASENTSTDTEKSQSNKKTFDYSKELNLFRQKTIQYYKDYYLRLADPRSRLGTQRKQLKSLTQYSKLHGSNNPSLFINNTMPSSPDSSLKPISQAITVCDACQPSAWKCEHCSIIFLDSVVYTIHTGLHSNTNPFQCNVCGVVAENKYEFSCHIARGEHTNLRTTTQNFVASSINSTTSADSL